MTTRSISITNRHPKLRVDRRALGQAIAKLDRHAELFAASSQSAPGVPAGELSLVFLTDEALAQLHAEFLDDPSVTDVITFEGNPRFGSAGEICVSVDAALRQTSCESPARRGKRRSAGVRRREAGAFADELLLYVIHGWLHLAGYDDLAPAKKRIMRRAETRAMRLVRPPAAGDRPFALQPAAAGKSPRS